MEEKKIIPANLGIIITVILAAVLLGFIFIPGYFDKQRLSTQNRELEKQIELIKRANTGLKYQELQAKDPFYLEKTAREKLGVARKGEVVYKVTPQTKE